MKTLPSRPPVLFHLCATLCLCGVMALALAFPAPPTQAAELNIYGGGGGVNATGGNGGNGGSTGGGNTSTSTPAKPETPDSKDEDNSVIPEEPEKVTWATSLTKKYFQGISSCLLYTSPSPRDA